jgi:hypothetical protein
MSQRSYKHDNRVVDMHRLRIGNRTRIGNRLRIVVLVKNDFLFVYNVVVTH